MGHTPGPWRWDEEEGEIQGPDGKAIVETDGGCYAPRGGDKALIAAAPELLDALNSLMLEYKCAIESEYNWKDKDETSSIWVACKNAVAKAKGRS